jgi:endonuclease-3 related protein
VTPRWLYKALLVRFGRQGWWPVTEPGAAKPSYRPGRPFPKSDRQKLEIAVGAILTQNTAWTNVEKALANLHRERALDVPNLASAKLSTLARLVRPSGYFRQKAMKLRVFARHVRSRGGRLAPLFEGRPAAAREGLLGLWGVGPETADSMLLYAGGRTVFVIDAYTLRIARRLGWLEAEDGYESAPRWFEARLPRSARVYAEFHALLVELAKRHCKIRPECEGCPARRGCDYAEKHESH